MKNLCYSFAQTVKNWGDDINPQMFEWITGEAPNPMMIHGRGHNPHFLGIGSIVECANSQSIVWGSGLMNSNGSISHAANYRSVRGPLTRERIVKFGGKCPEVYGDPALLVPKYYDTVMPVEYELGIIPHFIDQDLVSCDIEGVNIIDIGSGTFNFVDEVRKCKTIISSSLHGLILADSYGIPSRWVKFSNRLHGDGVKFRDYFASMGYAERCIDLRGVTLDKGFADEVVKHINFHPMTVDLDKLLDACPYN